jgi:hypothetical protein
MMLHAAALGFALEYAISCDGLDFNKTHQLLVCVYGDWINIQIP